MDLTAAKLARCFREPSYAWGVLRGRAGRARAAYLRRVHGIVPPPTKAIIQVTAACNRRCSMCNLWGEHGVYRQRSSADLHVPFEQFQRLYDQVLPFASTVELMGGEPLVHPRFRDIIEYARSRPLPLSVETNGVLLERYADILSSPPVSVLNVSIDGPEEVHDRIRGAEGTFRACLRGIAAVRERRPSGGPPWIQVRCTINRQNYHLLESTARMLADVGIDLFILQHLIYYSPVVHPENERVMKEVFGIDPPPEGYGLPDSPGSIDGQKVVDSIRALRRAELPFPVVPNPNYDDDVVLEYYRGGQIREPRKRCLAPYHQISIDYQGEVSACGCVYIGNALEEGVLGVWNNERFRSFRKRMDRLERIPLCKICCYPD